MHSRDHYVITSRRSRVNKGGGGAAKMSLRHSWCNTISPSPLSSLSHTAANKSISTVFERAAIFCCHHHFILLLIFPPLPLSLFISLQKHNIHFLKKNLQLWTCRQIIETPNGKTISIHRIYVKIYSTRILHCQK